MFLVIDQSRGMAKKSPLFQNCLISYDRHILQQRLFLTNLTYAKADIIM